MLVVVGCIVIISECACLSKCMSVCVSVCQHVCIYVSVCVLSVCVWSGASVECVRLSCSVLAFEEEPDCLVQCVCVCVCVCEFVCVECVSMCACALACVSLHVYMFVHV